MDSIFYLPVFNAQYIDIHERTNRDEVDRNPAVCGLSISKYHKITPFRQYVRLCYKIFLLRQYMPPQIHTFNCLKHKIVSPNIFSIHSNGYFFLSFFFFHIKMIWANNVLKTLNGWEQTEINHNWIDSWAKKRRFRWWFFKFNIFARELLACGWHHSPGLGFLFYYVVIIINHW